MPEFVYDVELQLQRANTDFQNNGTLSSSPGLKSDSPESLASSYECSTVDWYPWIPDIWHGEAAN